LPLQQPQPIAPEPQKSGHKLVAGLFTLIVVAAAAAATNKNKYGADFYAKIGAKGGKLGRTGGFYANRELARAAGAKGGRISRRTKKTA
ncbi:MAG TPA: hypothetical protein VII55_02545, partial [Candidatus Saccharimonadales bacterium]